MKQIIFQAILTAEAHLKAIFAHRFAEIHKNVPYSYLNVNCYDEKKILSAVETISKLSKIIFKYKEIKRSSIYHYIRNHNDVPIWVLINYIDFGGLYYMLSYSTTSIQNLVAKDFSGFIAQHLSTNKPFPPETMLSFIKNMNDVRNICAHNNRLLGYRCRSDCKYWAPLHDKYNISASDNRSSVYTVFLSLQCFLSSDEYARLHNTIRKRMCIQLKNNLHTIPFNKILSTLGFPNDWFLNVDKLIQSTSALPKSDVPAQ